MLIFAAAPGASDGPHDGLRQPVEQRQEAKLGLGKHKPWCEGTKDVCLLYLDHSLLQPFSISFLICAGLGTCRVGSSSSLLGRGFVGTFGEADPVEWRVGRQVFGRGSDLLRGQPKAALPSLCF